jgi:A/G-specific adenine glycosylase
MARKARAPTEREAGSAGDAAPDLDAAWRERVRARLVAWYGDSGRELPWRADRDPYRILVSETMLVQTTVAAVVPYFERFLARFPTVRALAEADEAEVVKAWEGLGYYRRARQLHEAARTVAREHGGEIPDDPEALRALPGVGRYIAGAILSFAFGRAAPIVEANTQRVLARWLAWEEDVRTSRSQSRLWEAAGRIVPEDEPGTFNQAFMELGALVCIPKRPMCLTCPVAADCLARRAGLQDALPVVAPRPAPLEVAEACVAVVHDGRVLVVHRGSGSLWDGFWELPTIHLSGPDPARRSFSAPVALAEGARRITGVSATVGPVAHTVRFGVTKHRVTLHVHLARRIEGEPRPGSGFTGAMWANLAELSALTLGSATRRVVAWLDRGGLVDPEGRMPSPGAHERPRGERHPE